MPGQMLEVLLGHYFSTVLCKTVCWSLSIFKDNMFGYLLRLRRVVEIHHGSLAYQSHLEIWYSRGIACAFFPIQKHNGVVSRNDVFALK